jgi:hypothetical protein
MLGNIKFLVAMAFFTVLYVTTVAPALESVAADIKSVGGASTVAIIEGIETALFVGLPLVFVVGIVLVTFVSASGLRGSSR